MPNRQIRRQPLVAFLSSLTIALGVLGGCYGAPPKPVPPEAEEERFAGLEVSLDSSGPEHVLVVRPPTAGYVCTIDYVGDAFGGKDVYLLIKEPNALYVHSGTNHPARISTGVKREVFIRVLAQQVPHGAKVEREGYRVVTLSAPGR